MHWLTHALAHPCSGSLIASADRDTPALLDLTDFKRDLSELTDRLGHAQDCL